jgi:hypothetical protein
MIRIAGTAALIGLVSVTVSLGQTLSSSDSSSRFKSDKGHWLALRVGAITGGADIGNRWIILGGYETRFAKNWSIPIEAQVFEDVNYGRSWFMLSAALKLRFRLFRPDVNVFAQGGIGTYIMYYPLHYAVGFEYGLHDRLSLYLQVKKFDKNSEINDAFISLGINFNVATERLRQEYEREN